MFDVESPYAECSLKLGFDFRFTFAYIWAAEFGVGKLQQSWDCNFHRLMSDREYVDHDLNDLNFERVK